MNKMVRFLSFVMLIAMCFSIMSVGAYAAPAVIVPGNNSNNSGTVFSYGTDPFTQAALENGEILSGNSSIVTESDGRVVSDGRDPSLYIQNVDEEVSETVKELVGKYSSDININNDTNPYYFIWLMNKFVNGDIDYSNPDAELNTARVLFGDFIDEAATELATAAASNQVLEDEEKKEAVEAVADEETEATLDQEAIADEAIKEIQSVATEIIEDIEKVDGTSFSGASSSYSGSLKVSSALYSGAELKVKKTAYDGDDLHKAISANAEIYFDECVELDSSYEGDIVFDFKNSTITCDDNYFIYVTDGLFKFKNGNIDNGFIEVNGGSVILDNMKVTVPSSQKSAVHVVDGYVDINRSNYFKSESEAPVVLVENGNVIIDGYVYSDTASCGLQIDDGKVTKNGGEILEDAPNSDITAPTGVIVNGGTFIFNGGTITGTKKGGSTGEGAAIWAKEGSGQYISINSGSTGCILSSFNAAIWSVDGQGSEPSGTTITVADVDYLKDASGYESDITKGVSVATVNKKGFSNLQDAIDYATDSSSEGYGYPVQITNDVELSGGVKINGDVVINGNGHTLFYEGQIFEIDDGNTVLENINLDSKDADADTILVKGGSASLNDVTVDNCSKSCLRNDGGDVTIDGFNCEESGSGTIAISATDGTTLVYDMTTKSEKPVSDSESTGVKVYQATCKVPAGVTSVDEFKDSGCGEISNCLGSGSSEVVSGGYYYITAREVTVSIASDDGGDGSYILYNKALDEHAIQLETSDAVSSLTAYGEDGTAYPLNFTPSKDYKSVTITPATLEQLPAGKYTVSVKFKNSGAVKVPLYVSPEINSTSNVDDDDDDATDLILTKYDSDNEIWLYNAQSHEDGWMQIPEEDLPVRIGLGPDQESVIWISDECISDSVNANGKYEVTLLHDDLDHLGNGINYIWLDYGSYWIPVEFKVYNAAATITPTTTDWNKIDGDKVFTVYPDVLTVKLNGESLESDKEYTYKNGKLTIKQSFLKKLENGSYTLEVSTSKGGVYSDLTIGEVLRPKDIDYHVYGGTKAITFVGSNDIDYTKGIWIGKTNPTEIPSEYYTINSDNTFTLSSAYLNKFSTLGTYYISAWVGGQYCTTTFRIISASQAAYNPSTGDDSNIVMWIVILVLAAVVIVVILIPTLKKKKISGKVSEEEKDVPEDDNK